MTRTISFHKAVARGFSLIEVLVTVVVLSLGLLGLAALQSVSIKNNQSSNFRSQATALAYMMLDQMRANRVEVIKGSYYTQYATAVATADCTAVKLAALTAMPKRDIQQWKCALQDQLPGGQGEIRFPGSGQVQVAIKWTDGRWSNTAPTSEFALTSSF